MSTVLPEPSQSDVSQRHDEKKYRAVAAASPPEAPTPSPALQDVLAAMEKLKQELNTQKELNLLLETRIASLESQPRRREGSEGRHIRVSAL